MCAPEPDTTGMFQEDDRERVAASFCLGDRVALACWKTDILEAESLIKKEKDRERLAESFRLLNDVRSGLTS